MRLLVTGGAGFIGSHFIRYVLREAPAISIVNLDKLTYAGNLENLRDVADDPRYRFVHGDIADAETVEAVFRHGIDAVVNFAAESHVDRSILNAALFVRSNISGVQILLDAALRHGVHRFLQVSTDEVYGPAADGAAFVEESPLAPSSPYAASKAAADLLCQAYFRTHGVPVVITRCTNNYGPYQTPEKFIPLTITNALDGRPVPIYGDGQQERDWLFVEDHCAALLHVLSAAPPGAILNIAAGRTWANKTVAHMILEMVGASPTLVKFVSDRPAHDRRYALDTAAIKRLGWHPTISFEDGLARTVTWFRTHREWWEPIKTHRLHQHYTRWYEQQLGTVVK